MNHRHRRRVKKHTETPGRVQAGKHPSTEESRGELDVPTVVLQADDAGETQTVKGPTNVPVKDDTGCVAGHNLVDKADDERVAQRQ